MTVPTAGPTAPATARSSRRRVRLVEAARAAWGATLLLAPRTVLTHVHGVRVDERSLVVARVLGARHLVQAGATLVTPRPAGLALGVVVDVLHAATAAGLAALDPTRRRAGVVDTVSATVWAVAGARAASRAREGRRGVG